MGGAATSAWPAHQLADGEVTNRPTPTTSAWPGRQQQPPAAVITAYLAEHGNGAVKSATLAASGGGWPPGTGRLISRQSPVLALWRVPYAASAMGLTRLDAPPHAQGCLSADLPRMSLTGYQIGADRRGINGSCRQTLAQAVATTLQRHGIAIVCVRA
jgi:hypothetical protein